MFYRGLGQRLARETVVESFRYGSVFDIGRDGSPEGVEV